MGSRDAAGAKASNRVRDPKEHREDLRCSSGSSSESSTTPPPTRHSQGSKPIRALPGKSSHGDKAMDRSRSSRRVQQPLLRVNRVQVLFHHVFPIKEKRV